MPSSASNGLGASGGDIQIDLNQVQSQAAVFNLSGVPVNTYFSVQVVIDPNNPGTIVPACQGSGAGQEGCASYPIVIDNARQGITFTIQSGFNTSKNTTAPMLINLAASIAPPGLQNGVYNLSVDASLANFAAYMGTITGTVSGGKGTHSLHLRPLTVSAELAGTGTVVESASVIGNGYTLVLPASPSGTSYDLYLSGGSDAFVPLPASQAPLKPLKPGDNIIDANFQTAAVQLGAVSGTILDSCNRQPIVGATVNILAPTTKTVDCSVTPADCAVVGTTSTDQGGNYPLPGNNSNPSIFSEFPVGTNFGLQLEISASGYTPIFEKVEVPNTSTMDCADSFDKHNCSFSLLTSTLSGTVSLSQTPTAGTAVQVEVFAENSGTNQLVSALPVPLLFMSGITSAPFTLNVPTGAGIGPFDLFAVAIDPYLGAPDPYPGHTIATLADVPGPAQCIDSAIGDIGPLDCAGHGSISGTVTNPDSSTTIQVAAPDPSNKDVLVTGTTPGLLSSATGSSNQYVLCVPPGNYTVQRYEGNTPGASQSVAVPVPAATSTPCPSTCFSDNSGTICPGLCSPTFANF